MSQAKLRAFAYNAAGKPSQGTRQVGEGSLWVGTSEQDYSSSYAHLVWYGGPNEGHEFYLYGFIDNELPRFFDMGKSTTAGFVNWVNDYFNKSYTPFQGEEAKIWAEGHAPYIWTNFLEPDPPGWRPKK